MRPTTCLLVLIFSLALGGCYKTVTEKQLTLKMNKEEKEILQKECTEINSQGDIMKLLAEIKRDTNEVIGILEGDNLEAEESRIEILADRIDQKTKLVLSLSRDSWVKERWDFEVKWLLDREDFKDLWGSHLKNGFQITRAKLQDAYLMGEKRSDLLDHVRLTRRGSRVEIFYQNRGSSLEICQLQKTLMIMAEVNYRNITNKNVRYFNLIVK